MHFNELVGNCVFFLCHACIVYWLLARLLFAELALCPGSVCLPTPGICYRTNYSDMSTTLEEEELPYQLIAGDMDSNHFETSNIERDSSIQSRATEKERVLQLLNPIDHTCSDHF